MASSTSLVDLYLTPGDRRALSALKDLAPELWGVSELSDSVEVFNPATGTWSTAPPMLTARTNHSSVLLDCEIYITGGRDGDNR